MNTMSKLFLILLALGMIAGVVGEALEPWYKLSITLSWGNRRVIISNGAVTYGSTGVNTTVTYDFSTTDQLDNFTVSGNDTETVSKYVYAGMGRFRATSGTYILDFYVVFPKIIPYNTSFFISVKANSANLTIEAMNGTSILTNTTLTNNTVNSFSAYAEYYRIHVRAQGIWDSANSYYYIIVDIDDVSIYCNHPAIVSDTNTFIVFNGRTVNGTQLLVPLGTYTVIAFYNTSLRVRFYNEETRNPTTTWGTLYSLNASKTYLVNNTSFCDIPLSDLGLNEKNMSEALLGVANYIIPLKFDIEDKQFFRGCVARAQNNYACNIYVLDTSSAQVYTVSTSVASYYVQVQDAYYNIVDEQYSSTNNLPIVLGKGRAYIVKIYDTSWALVESYYIYVNVTSTTTYNLPTASIITPTVNVSVSYSSNISLPEIVKLMVSSELGKISLMLIPILVLMVSGRHFAGISAIIAAVLAYAINYYTGEEIFSTIGVGTVLFIGILGLLLERK